MRSKNNLSLIESFELLIKVIETHGEHPGIMAIADPDGSLQAYINRSGVVANEGLLISIKEAYRSWVNNSALKKAVFNYANWTKSNVLKRESLDKMNLSIKKLNEGLTNYLKANTVGVVNTTYNPTPIEDYKDHFKTLDAAISIVEKVLKLDLKSLLDKNAHAELVKLYTPDVKQVPNDYMELNDYDSGLYYYDFFVETISGRNRYDNEVKTASIKNDDPNFNYHDLSKLGYTNKSTLEIFGMLVKYLQKFVDLEKQTEEFISKHLKEAESLKSTDPQMSIKYYKVIRHDVYSLLENCLSESFWYINYISTLFNDIILSNKKA